MNKTLVILSFTALLSCNGGNGQVDSENASNGHEMSHQEDTRSYAFGEIEKESAISIDQAILKLEESGDTSLEMTTLAPVSAVCEMMGCWMGIKTEEGQQVRVTFSDIKQVVPKDIVGDSAYVAGTLQLKELSVDMRRHLMMDRGFSEEEAIAKITTDTIEFALIANAVEILHK